MTEDGQVPASHLSAYHDAMMALRASRTSAAARRCWGSRTSSFRMRHTVFSETRPSLVRQKETERAQMGQLVVLGLSNPGPRFFVSPLQP